MTSSEKTLRGRKSVWRRTTSPVTFCVAPAMLPWHESCARSEVSKLPHFETCTKREQMRAELWSDYKFHLRVPILEITFQNKFFFYHLGLLSSFYHTVYQSGSVYCATLFPLSVQIIISFLCKRSWNKMQFQEMNCLYLSSSNLDGVVWTKGLTIIIIHSHFVKRSIRCLKKISYSAL